MFSLQFAVSCYVGSLVSHCCKEIVAHILAGFNVFYLVSNDEEKMYYAISCGMCFVSTL